MVQWLECVARKYFYPAEVANYSSVVLLVGVEVNCANGWLFDVSTFVVFLRCCKFSPMKFK